MNKDLYIWQSYKQERVCPMHFARLANTLLKDEESARDNHVLACNFAKYLPTLKKITDRYFTVAESIGATYSNCWNTQGDSGVISFHIYACWFSPPFCGQNSHICLLL